MKKLITVLFILLANSLFASKLPDTSKIESFDDFSYGLNTEDVAHKMDKRYAQSISNIRIDEEDGRLKKINGFIVSGTTNTLNNKINFLFLYKNQSGEKEYIVSDSSIILTTKDFSSWTNIKSGLNTNQLLQAVQVRDKVWFTNGADDVFTYDGSTVVVLNGSRYGTLDTPDVPKGKYIAFFQERVFVYNTSDNDSSLYFTDLVSTNAVLIAPDNYLAWNSDNQLNIGQGDGQAGTALFVYRGNLYCGKERSIYRINGTDKYSYFASKTDSKVGISNQDAVTQIDNLVYFKSKGEGIYAFDGNNSERISDKINDEIKKFETQESNIVNLRWSLESDFNNGFYSNSRYDGEKITLLRSSPIAASTLSDSTSTIWGGLTAVQANTSTGYSTMTYLTLNGVDTNFIGLIWSVTWYTLGNGPAVGDICSGKVYDSIFDDEHATEADVDNKFSIRNNRTNDINVFWMDNTWSDMNYTNTVVNDGLDPTKASTSTYIYSLKNPFGSYSSVYGGIAGTWYRNKNFTYYDIVDGSVSVQWSAGASGNCPTLPSAIFSSSYTNSFGISFVSDFANYSYISGISTANLNIKSWDTFSAEYKTNGGNIYFYYRTSKNISSMSTQAWISIIDGGVIASSSTDKYIQWAATMSGTSLTNIPSISFVNISYNTGGTSDSRVLLNNWNNRIIVSGSTNSIDSTIFEKTKITNSNPIAWTKIDGINIKSLLNTQDYFFAGASTYSAVYRMDYGTNLNGSTITAHYETKDTDFDRPFFKKILQKYYLDVERENGAIIRVGTSIDGGDYTYKDIKIDGTGRHIYTINNVVGFGKSFKWRFENNQLDKDMKINGFWVVYETTEIE